MLHTSNSMRGLVKKLMFSVAIMLAAFGCRAQSLEPTCTIAGRFEQVVLDNLGNLYGVRGSEVLRYDAKCTQLYRHSDLMMGRIDHIDASNPLKILLFYRDFSKVMFLDNTLTPTQGSIDLRPLGLSLATQACTSFDNGMWVFDAVSYRLVRFNQNMHLTNEVPNIDLITGSRINPTAMMESADRLFVYDPKAGLFIFDVFGTFIRSLPHTGADQFIAYGELLMFRHGNRVEAIELDRLQESTFELGAVNVAGFDALKGVMAVIEPLNVQRYKLQRSQD